MNPRPDPAQFPVYVAKNPIFVPARPRRRTTPPIGKVLTDIGEVTSGDLLRAIAMRGRQDILIGEVLLANGFVREEALYRALSMQFNCDVADLSAQAPDPRLIDMIGVEHCLREGFIPWQRIGVRPVIVTANPERFGALLARLPRGFDKSLMAIAPRNQITAALVSVRHRDLVRRAETRVEANESCRDWSAPAAARYALAAILFLAAFLIIAPRAAFVGLCALAFVALAVNTSLKLAAAIAMARGSGGRSLVFTSSRHKQGMMKLPVVSILVPLYREKAIAGRLIRRLSRLNYPREMLDICLIVEEDDWQTQASLSGPGIPTFIRRIHVPRGALKTKPRALNFALDFCRGSIVGVLDAEDAPEPDQIFRIVRRFWDAGPRVACLQGVLDFYNSRENWLSRCFSIEYATWFRVVLPGLERLGLVVPLGGTTLYFRRDILGGVDVHRV